MLVFVEGEKLETKPTYGTRLQLNSWAILVGDVCSHQLRSFFFVPLMPYIIHFTLHISLPCWKAQYCPLWFTILSFLVNLIFMGVRSLHVLSTCSILAATKSFRILNISIITAKRLQHAMFNGQYCVCKIHHLYWRHL